MNKKNDDKLVKNMKNNFLIGGSFRFSRDISQQKSNNFQFHFLSLISCNEKFSTSIGES